MKSKTMLLVLAASCSLVAAADKKATPSSGVVDPYYSIFPDKVVARGKGFEIKQSQVDEMFIAFKSNRGAHGQTIPEEMRSKIEADILEKLIATQLFVKRATSADHSKAKGIAQEFIAAQLKQVPSEESLNRQLRSLGMTPEQFRAQVLEQAVVKAVIDREIKVGKSIPDAEVKKFYDDNPQLFDEPEKVRTGHILFSTQIPQTTRELPPAQKAEKKKLAQKVLQRARSGEDFAKLTLEFSDDKIARDKGGEYTFARAKDDPRRPFPAEFEAAAFSLGVGKISDLVETRFGFHIIKLLEKIPSRKQPLTAVSERIKETLIQEYVQKQLPGFVEKLKKESGVEILAKKS